MDGLLLQSVEGLGDPPVGLAGCEVWEWLQGEKEAVTREIISEGPIFMPSSNGPQEFEPSEESPREIEWHHREQLEARLREINDAQDRLMAGKFGYCTDCGKEIEPRRLAAEPTASLCISCQRNAEAEFLFHRL
jgi:RNA polymerase-binding transcription factor DksA